MFVQVAEEGKADEYVIGQDLAKGGVASKRAQLWVNRYNTKLSVNTQALIDDEAEYPLGIYAPYDGEFTIHADNIYDAYDLYLTQNGKAIWNLSHGACALTLDKGTTSTYGLRVGAKGPQVLTGMDELIVNAQGETRKVLIDDKVFIIRNNEVYTVTGKKVQ